MTSPDENMIEAAIDARRKATEEADEAEMNIDPQTLEAIGFDAMLTDYRTRTGIDVADVVAKLSAGTHVVVPVEPFTKKVAERTNPKKLECFWASYTDHAPPKWEGWVDIGMQHYGNPYDPKMSCLLWVRPIRAAQEKVE